MIKVVSPFTASFKSIKKQFILKEKLIERSFLVQKKSSDDKRRNDERETRINYENTLEKALDFLGRPIKKLGKKLGFLDSLKQFITNVLLGFIAIRLLKYLPQLMKVFTLILRVGDFILDISGKLLNGLITFVDKGYQAADHARKMVKSIGGQKAVNALDAMNNQANSLLNSIIIAGMLFSDFGGVGLRGVASKKAVDAGTEIIEEQVKRQVAEKAAQEVAKQGVRTAIGPLGAAGIVLGVGLLSSAVGEGAFQIKKFGKQLQSWTSGKLTEASQDKNPVTRFFKKGFFGWLSTTLGPAIWLLNGTGVLFDIVGSPFRYGVELIRAAVMKLNDDRKGLEQQNKNLGKFDARVRDGIREHFSILAPLFSFMDMKGVSQKLQTPGSFGSLYGEKAAKDMGYYRGGLVIKKFAGGGYARSVGDEDEVKAPRTFKKDLSGISPGSAVGGSGVIQKVFPYSNEKGVMNQYEYVDSSYQSLSGKNYVGPLLGLTIKSIFGDKVTDADYDIVSGTLSSFLLSGAQEENPQVANRIYSSLGTDGLKPFIKGEILSSLQNTFGLIENQLRIQLGLYPPPGSTEGSEADACAAACDTGGGAAVYGDATDKAILDLISSVEAKDYDTMNVSRGATAGKPTQMTVDWLAANANGAIGRYQHMPAYVKGRVIAAGFKGSDKFTPEVQDRTTLHFLYTSHSYKQWRSGQLSDEEFGNKLSATWRGLPHSSGGTYPDQYASGNKAHMSRPAFMSRLAQIKKGAGPSTAKIAPGSPAANVSDCVCDPEIPDGTLPPPVQQPAGGRIVTSEMGMRKLALSPGMHMGVDISGNVGEYLKAFTSGTVEDVGYDGGYGNYVNWIDSFGVAHFYGHMKNPASVKRGQKVNAGTVLGLLGNTGKSTGPHLHWEAATNPSDTGRDKSAVLSRFNPLSRYSKESPFTGSRQSGGPTISGGTKLLHKGEYVIDKDSVDLFGGIPFFTLINNVENENQRAQKSSQLIQHLSKYTGRKIDQRPEVIFEEPEDTIIMSPPIYVSTLSSYGGSGEESPNWEQDMCYARG